VAALIAIRYLGRSERARLAERAAVARVEPLPSLTGLAAQLRIGSSILAVVGREEHP